MGAGTCGTMPRGNVKLCGVGEGTVPDLALRSRPFGARLLSYHIYQPDVI